MTEKQVMSEKRYAQCFVHGRKMKNEKENNNKFLKKGR